MSDASLLCGPNELSQAIIDYREEMKQIFDICGGPVLLDEWIREIVQLVYHASLLPDEGRYPRFRIVVTNTSSCDGIKLSWPVPRLDSPESLRRLAPAVSGNGTALLVFADQRLVTLCAELHNSVKLDTRIECYAPNPEVFAKDFADLWAAVLSTAIEGRHGGAFVIVPSSDCHHVTPKYRSEGGLFTAFEKTLRHCLDATDSSGPFYLWRFKQYWKSHEDHLRRLARVIGQLAAMDGCVVLDRRLNLQGFGAKIDYSPDATFLPLVDARTDRNVSEEEIAKGMGTRHRSACRLAQILPGVIIFVVSQDGDLTAVYSDDSRAYRVKQLDAWSSVSEVL